MFDKQIKWHKVSHFQEISHFFSDKGVKGMF